MADGESWAAETVSRAPAAMGRLLAWKTHAGTRGRLLLSILAIAAIVRSLHYVWAYQTPAAWFDFWFWVADFQRWANGTYTFHDLIKPHYEHRIVTTRLLLLPDSIFFGMNGVLPSVANLGFLAATGLMVWRLARVAALPPLFWIAWFFATCQVENLLFPFQVQFSITLCLAAGACLLLADATRASSSRGAAWRSALAGLLAIGAAFSTGGGVLLFPGLLALLWLRRARLAASLPASGLALLGVWLFFHDYDAGTRTPMFRASLVMPRILYVGNFLGSAFTAFPGLAWAIGLALLGLFLWCALWLGRRALVCWNEAALAGLGLFIALCGPAGSLTGRILMGPRAALVTRYSTLSLAFLAIVFVLLLCRFLPGRERWRDGAAGAAGAALLLALNVPFYNQFARWFALPVRANADLLTNNVGIEGPAMLVFGGHVDDLRAQIAFLQRSKLNSFSPAETMPEAWRAAVARRAAGPLPACRGFVDWVSALDEHAVLTAGWLAAPDGRRGAAWVVAVDTQGRVLGAARPVDARPDVEAALGGALVRGFQTGFRLREDPDPAGDRRAFHLIGVLPGAGLDLCRLPATVEVGPVASEPIGRLLDPVPARARVSTKGPVTGAAAAAGAGTVWRVPEGAAATLGFLVADAPSGRALAVPFSAAGMAAGRRVTFRFADGSAFAGSMPVWWGRADWWGVVLPADLIARHPGPVTAQVAVAPGPAIAVGAPVWVRTVPDWSRLFND